MSKILIFIIVLAILFSAYFAYSHLETQHVREINTKSDPTRETNPYAFPLIDDNNRYIEKQTKEWIKKRDIKQPCYAVLEKDKIVMCKWIEKLEVKSPKIHYYSYHDQFSFEDLSRVVQENKNKFLIVKITHLQSNYGIILIKPGSDLDLIYKQICDKFKTCFVCNHDKSDPPKNKDIRKGKKSSYYKLYETIKPGVMIQDFFESYPASKRGKSTPIEIKILMLGDNVLGYVGKKGLFFNKKRYQPLFEEARRISRLLGATLIRVDFFIKKEDNPFVPYLNEISLSPNGGMRKAFSFEEKELVKMKQEIENSPRGSFPEINKLIEECPFRDIPIERYLTDAESTKEKY